jgi:hypothetical protein
MKGDGIPHNTMLGKAPLNSIYCLLARTARQESRPTSDTLFFFPPIHPKQLGSTRFVEERDFTNVTYSDSKGFEPQNTRANLRYLRLRNFQFCIASKPELECVVPAVADATERNLKLTATSLPQTPPLPERESEWS